MPPFWWVVVLVWMSNGDAYEDIEFDVSETKYEMAIFQSYFPFTIVSKNVNEFQFIQKRHES